MSEEYELVCPYCNRAFNVTPRFVATTASLLNQQKAYYLNSDLARYLAGAFGLDPKEIDEVRLQPVNPQSESFVYSIWYCPMDDTWNIIRCSDADDEDMENMEDEE